MFNLLIFTDLNDTLLNANYDFSAAGEALALLKERGIPLIITTSKTRGQVEIYRKALEIKFPMIVENGGAAHFPVGSFDTGKLPKGCIFTGGEAVWEWGRSVQFILPNLLLAARVVGAEVETVWDMTSERIAEITGMPAEEAEACKERRYCVYFLVHHRKDELFEELRKRGYQPTYGSYFYHLGWGSKGVAVKKLAELYRSACGGEWKTAALGDNANDISMLQAVDYPMLVERPGGGYAEGVEVKRLQKLAGVGPAGWNEGVKRLMADGG